MLDRLRVLAQTSSHRAHVPYSGRPVGAAVLLSDGRWTAAPRIENASFPLTIPAVQGALALAALAGGAPAAVALSRPLTRGERAHMEDTAPGPWREEAPDVLVQDGALPVEIGSAVALSRDLPPPPDGPAGTALAYAAAEEAVVPASGFRVGAAVVDDAGRIAVGANVEQTADWTRGLCAERTALVRAVAAGFGPIRQVFVACASAPGGTPCGGCRQVIAELAFDADVVVWRGVGEDPLTTTVADLLPGAFRGERLTS